MKKIKLQLNGVEVGVHLEMPQKYRDNYEMFWLEGDQYCWVSSYTEFARCVLTCFDYAMPQNFFNEWIEQYGEAPRGVWSYDPAPRGVPIWGGFVSRNTLMCWFEEDLRKAYREHKRQEHAN